MRTRKVLTTAAAGLTALAIVALPADAAHTKGKKLHGLQLTAAAAQAANDGFGVLADTSGSATLYLNHGQDRVCIRAEFDGQEIVALHIHEKDADSDNPQTGPVVVDFAAALDADDPATDTQEADVCLTGQDNRDTIRGILSTPDEYYINAHGPDLSVIRTNLGHN